MFNYSFTTVPTDGLASLGTRASASAVITKLGRGKYNFGCQWIGTSPVPDHLHSPC